MEALQLENAQLKRSVFELSYHYNKTMATLKAQMGQQPHRDWGVIDVGGRGGGGEGGGGKAVEKKERRRAGDGDGGRKEDRARGAGSVGWDEEEDELRLDRVLSSASTASAPAPAASTSSASSSTSSSRVFSKKVDLTGHSAAVYALTFSGDGRLLASGGMDKAIRVWDMHALVAATAASSSSSSSSSTPAITTASAGGGASAGSTSRYQLLNLSAHTLNISSLAFASSSPSPSSSSSSTPPLLISASFDKTVAYHDLTSAATVLSVDVGAFATSVSPSLTSPHLCYAGTTGKRILTIDRRSSDPIASTWDNSAMLSAVTAQPSDELLTGDHAGCIKRWDARMGRCLATHANDPQGRPISDLHSLRPAPLALTRRGVGVGVGEGGEEKEVGADVPLLAVNSFDDTLRLYAMGRRADARRGGGGGAGKGGGGKGGRDEGKGVVS